MRAQGPPRPRGRRVLVDSGPGGGPRRYSGPAAAAGRWFHGIVPCACGGAHLFCRDEVTTRIRFPRNSSSPVHPESNRRVVGSLRESDASAVKGAVFLHRFPPDQTDRLVAGDRFEVDGQDQNGPRVDFEVDCRRIPVEPTARVDQREHSAGRRVLPSVAAEKSRQRVSPRRTVLEHAKPGPLADGSSGGGVTHVVPGLVETRGRWLRWSLPIWAVDIPRPNQPSAPRSVKPTQAGATGARC